jgi:hypothetical protein
MSIKLGEIVMPCRSCGVPPGHPCFRWRKGHKQYIQTFHAARIRDAAMASELIA